MLLVMSPACFSFFFPLQGGISTKQFLAVAVLTSHISILSLRQCYWNGTGNHSVLSEISQTVLQLVEQWDSLPGMNR